MPPNLPPPRFAEAGLTATPIRDLGLTLAGTALEPMIETLREELRTHGFTHLEPHFYLSTEWGVAFDTVAVAIPFYLASKELTDVHRDRHGHVEGGSPEDILRYLRHEVGHVVNYAYRLYDDAEWQAIFGRISAPYVEEYRPVPFDRDFVWHLPGWYAQKHPDEDWAETFAVCITPGLDWRLAYADAPGALRKLVYCAAVLERVKGAEPVQASALRDEDVSEIRDSIDQLYAPLDLEIALDEGMLDLALGTAFAGFGAPAEGQRVFPFGELIAREESTLLEEVYRWTGHFPERTRPLLRALAGRGEARALTVAEADLAAATITLTCLVTALASNHVHRGAYLAGARASARVPRDSSPP